MNRRDALEKLFKQLPVLVGEDYHIEIVVDMLARIDGAHSRAVPDAFSIVGHTKTEKELTKIVKHAAALAKCFESLHQPAILLLADMGLCNMRNELPKILHDMESKIRNVELSVLREPPKGGRPDDKLAQAVANIVACYYHKITGKDPGRIVDARVGDSTSYGPFMHLLSEVFSILNIKASSDHYAKEAAKTFYERSLVTYQN